MKKPNTSFSGARPTFIALLAAASFSLPVFADNTMKPGNESTSLFVTGTGIVQAPKYAGSDHDKIQPIPYLQAVKQTAGGRLSFDGSLGIAWAPIKNSEMGLLLSVDSGRKEKDDSNLKGLGNVKATVEYGAFTSYTLADTALKIAIKQGEHSGHDGLLVSLSAEHAFPLSEKISLSGGLNANWADGKYTQQYFGINAEQAFHSGYKAYSARAGLMSIGTTIGLKWQPTKNWIALANIGISRLQDDAQSSPVTKQATQKKFLTGIAYAW